ncbi:M1 family metallopeptidase [Engelhardtia mirabilis]|uniref:M1 family metallopeptidase n=1 Tax=Engelhardtia mirabilis TaxID=2528011 RepID=UPI0011A01080
MNERRRDWRGAIVADGERVRMSEQSLFLPQVLVSPGNRAPATFPWEAFVTVPKGIEMIMPGQMLEAPTDVPCGVRWRFGSSEPSTLWIVGARKPRIVIPPRESRSPAITAVMDDSPAHSAIDYARTLQDAVESYSELFAPTTLHTVAVVHDESMNYHWSSPGMVLLGRHGTRLPVGLIGHEAAHFWWGGATVFVGLGERFLTEGLAEYSAWRFMERRGSGDGATQRAREARNTLQVRAREGQPCPALLVANFDTLGYDTAVYLLAPLVLRYLELRIGQQRFDEFLGRLARRRIVGAADAVAEIGALLGGATEALIREAPWLLQPGPFEVLVESIESSSHGRHVELTTRFVRSNEQVSFDGVLSVTCHGRGGGDRCQRELRFVGGVGRASLAAPFEIAELWFDPDARFPARVPPVQRATAGGAWLALDTPPAVSAARFVPNASETGRGHLEVRFDRPMDGRMGINRVDQDEARQRGYKIPRVVDGEWREGGAVLDLWLQGLEPDELYTVPFRGRRFRDLYGMPLAAFDVRVAVGPAAANAEVVDGEPVDESDLVPS